MSSEMRKPLKEDEVVIHVPKGAASNIRIAESSDDLPSEMTVQISKKRKASVRPVLGVIVK